jgi:hypothetical protein
MKSITARYSAFEFSSDSSTYARKNCQVNLDIRYPAGLQYSVTDVTFIDNLKIGAGVYARHSSTSYFSGSEPTLSSHGQVIPKLTKILLDAAQNVVVHEYNGPVQGEYTYKEAVPASAQIWSPCGAPLPLNINNAVIWRKSSGGDAHFNGKTVVTGIVWRNC